MRIMVLSGAGRYADPWHDFPATSARLAEILAGPGRSVAIVDDVEAGLAGLEDVDLLVVNAGRPTDGLPNPASAAADASLRAYVDRRGPVLAVHAAANTLSTSAVWTSTIGGRWLPGTSMHPPFGRAQIIRQAPEHPIARGLGDLELDDERYSYLAIESGITVLYDHEHDDLRHPVIWCLETSDGRRAVYDGLGHSVESYENEAHRQLLRRAAGWLLREN